MYSNLADEAKVLGRLEISGKYITDYSLIFGEKAKTLVYEPIFDKFETLKLGIKKESAYDPHKLIKEQKGKGDDKQKQDAKEGLIIVSTIRAKENEQFSSKPKEAKQIAETVKAERAGNLTYNEIQEAKQKAKAQGAGNNTYYVKEG